MKPEFVCSVCLRIFASPILFPCNCTVCAEHLNDKEVLKTNLIKCETCQIEFNTKIDTFKPNEQMEKMLSEDFHLSDEEKVLKLQVEQTMAQLYQLCDDLREKNSLLEVTVYDHFQEIRRQIDIRHEEANCSNDKLYMNMIGRTNHTQAQYMEHLKKETDRAFVQSQYGCLDKERTILKDVLRDPLLVNVKTIKARLEEEIVFVNISLIFLKIVHAKFKNHFFPLFIRVPRNFFQVER